MFSYHKYASNLSL